MDLEEDEAEEIGDDMSTDSSQHRTALTICVMWQQNGKESHANQVWPRWFDKEFCAYNGSSDALLCILSHLFCNDIGNADLIVILFHLTRLQVHGAENNQGKRVILYHDTILYHDLNFTTASIHNSKSSIEPTTFLGLISFGLF